MNFFETTNPKPDPEMSNEIRRAVEASYGSIHSQLRRLKSQADDRSRVERANITVVNSLAAMGSGTPGAMAFVIEDKDWYYWLVDHWEPLGAGGGGGNKPYDTLVIASSAYGLAPGLENADYVCDGTDDHIEINEAIASIGDGRIVFLEGEYWCNDQILISGSRRLELVGMGQDSTRLRRDDFEGGAIVRVDGGSDPQSVLISKLWIDADWLAEYCIHADGGTEVHVVDCYIDDAPSIGVWLDRVDEYSTIENCTFINNVVSLKVT